MSVLPGHVSIAVRNRGFFDGRGWHIVQTGSSRHKSRDSLSRTTTNGVGSPPIPPLIRLRFRADARLPFVCLSKRKEAKEKTPDTAPATPCRTRRGAGLSRRSRDATAGVRHEPEAATHTVRPAEGRIPQRRCGKALLRLSGRYSDARGNGIEYRHGLPKRYLYWAPWAQRRAVEAESEKDVRMSESRAARRVSGRSLLAGAAQGTDAKPRRKTGCPLLC